MLDFLTREPRMYIEGPLKHPAQGQNFISICSKQDSYRGPLNLGQVPSRHKPGLLNLH